MSFLISSYNKYSSAKVEGSMEGGIVRLENKSLSKPRDLMLELCKGTGNKE